MNKNKDRTKIIKLQEFVPKNRNKKELQIYEKWLQKFAQQSDDPVVRDSEEMIQYFLEGDENIPNEYSWPLPNLNIKRESCTSPDDVNKLLFHMIRRQIKAYAMIAYWRGAELIKTALRSLNMYEIIPSAVLSRSSIELAATFVWSSNNIKPNIERAVEKDQIKKKKNIIRMDDEFDFLIDAPMFGSRHDDFKRAPSPDNIMKTLRKVTNVTGSDELVSIYSHLCDLAHPNVIGNARFWGQEEPKDDGSKTLYIGRTVESIATAEIVEKVLWAIAKSGVWIRNSYHEIQDAIELIEENWPVKPGHES